MKKLLRVGMLACGTLISAVGFSQTHITSNTTWSTDQILTQAVIVDPGVTLTIEAGVTVQTLFVDTDLDLIGDVELIVNGELVVQGTQCSPVLFEPYSVTDYKDWSGITFNSTTNNNSITWLKVDYAYKAIDIQSEVTIQGLEVMNCREGISVQSSAVATIEDGLVHDQENTGIVNYGGTLTINNCDIRDNGKFGVASNAGVFVMGFSDVRDNGYSGVFLGGAVNADVQNSDITGNAGSGVEVSDMIFTDDCFTPGAGGGDPTIVVVSNNIFGNANTVTNLVQSSINGFYQVPTWEACPSYGGYSNSYTHYLVGPTFGEVPFGELVQVYGKFMYYSNYPVTYYKIKEPGTGTTLASGTANSNTAGSCGGSAYKRQEYLTLNLNAPNQQFYWEASKPSSNYIMYYAITDPVFTVEIGGYEVYSTVENTDNMDFTQNYWGQILGVDTLMYNINTANIDYSGYAVSQIPGIGTNITDGLPVVDLGVDAVVCQGTPLTLDAGNNGSSYVWSTGSNNQSIDVSTVGQYYVDVTNACGSNSDTMYVTAVDPLPGTPATPTGQTLLCQDNINTDYITTGASDAVSYQWNITPASAGTISGTGTTGTVDWDAAFIGSADITVKGVNSCGQGVSSQIINVEIITSPNSAVTPSGPSSICAGGGNSTYTTIGATGATSYVWDISPASAGTLTPSGTSADVTWNGAFSGTATITVQGVNTCGSGSFSSPVNVNVSGPVGVPATPTGTASICQNAPNEDYTTTGATDAATYVWSISPAGAGTISGTGTTGTVDWDPSFTGTASISVAGENGCGVGTSSSVYSVTVNAGPTITASSNTSICYGASTTISASGASTYTWDNGAGTGNSVSVSPAASTTYTVTGDDGTGCTNTAQVTVTVNSLPTVVANASSTTICNGNSVTLTGSGASTYTWDNGATDGVAISPSSTTTYTVTGTDGNLCSSTDQVTVTVNGSPTTANATSTTLCDGQSVTLTGSGSGSYTWNNGVMDGVPFTPSNTATYTVTGDDGSGCTTTDQITIVVSSSPTVTASGGTAICEGQNAVLTASGATTYIWDNGAGSGSTVQVTPSTTTTYTVTGTNNGCDGTAQVTVIVNAAPTVVANSSATDVCEGEDVLLYGSGGASSYSWNLGVTDGVPFTPSFTLTYTVTGTGSNNCTATDEITVTVNENPSGTLSATDEMMGNDGEVDLLPSGGTPPYSYDWDNDGSGDFDDSEDLTGLDAGTYNVTIEDANGCTFTGSATVGSQVSIADNSTQLVQLFPNPTNGLLNIISDDYKNIEIIITDSRGRVVKTVSDNTGQVEVDLSSYENGIYQVTVKTENEVIVKKIILNK